MCERGDTSNPRASSVVRTSDGAADHCAVCGDCCVCTHSERNVNAVKRPSLHKLPTTLPSICHLSDTSARKERAAPGSHVTIIRIIRIRIGASVASDTVHRWHGGALVCARVRTWVRTARLLRRLRLLSNVGLPLQRHDVARNPPGRVSKTTAVSRAANPAPVRVRAGFFGGAKWYIYHSKVVYTRMYFFWRLSLFPLKVAYR